MSTPMHDVPDHLLVPVTRENQGPAEGSDYHHWACWCGKSDCREYTNDPYAQPSIIDDAQYAFPAALSTLLPSWDMIPKEFKDQSNEWVVFVDRWFGIRFPETGVVPRDDVDSSLAYRHLDTLIRSYEPKHEHKIAAVAWLASRWWDRIVTEEKTER